MSQNSNVFDFNRAKRLGSAGEIVDYLRHTAKTNANWEAIDKAVAQGAKTPNFNASQATLDLLSTSKDFQILDSGLSTDEAKARIAKLEAEAKPQDFSQQAKELGARVVGALDTIAPVSSVVNPLFFDNDKDYQERKNKSLQAAKIAQNFNLKSQDLDTQTQAVLAREEGLTFGDLFAPFKSDEERAQEILEKNRKLDSLLDKEWDDLDEKQKQAFKDDEGFFNRAWDSLFKEDIEVFEEWKEKRIGTQEISKELQRKINALNAIHEGKSIRNIFFGDEQTRQNYLDDVTQIAGIVGFDSAGFDDKGDLYLTKNEQKIKVNEGFFDNFWDILNTTKGELAGGIAGSIAGFKKGKGVKGKIANSIIGGALGSFVGASADVLAVNAYLDRENTARELIGHGLEAGVLSAAGDGVILALSKSAKPAIKKGWNLATKAIDDTAIGGLLRNIPSQNLRGAQKILSQSYTEEEKQALKDFAQEFGGAMEANNQSAIRVLKESLDTREFPLKSSAMKLLNAMDKPTLKESQLEILEQIRADKSGGTLGFLLEVANQSPQASKNLKAILNQTTHNLEKSLSALGLDSLSMQQVFKTLQRETKASYNEAMDLTLGKLYEEHKTTLDSAPFESFKKNLQEQGLLEEAKPFIDFISANVFNPNGVSFNQLENARKLLNSFHKNTQNPNLRDQIQKSIEKSLRGTIKQGIEDIFSQNKQMFVQAKNLYENALSDYAVMKETMKLAGVKKALDDKSSKEAAADSILKFIKGQGGEVSNFSKLKAGLDSAGVEELELGVIGNVFQKSLVTDEGLKVFDSKAFQSEIRALLPQFESKKAQEALNLLEGFHKLFLNDGHIAWELRAPSPLKEGSGLATSIGGAVKQKSVKIAFMGLLRLLPDVGIPLTPIKFTTFNEATQGASLRFHIQQALKQSVNVEDFTQNLTARAAKSRFNSATNQSLDSFLTQLNKIYGDTLGELENHNAKQAEIQNKITQEITEKNQLKEQLGLQEVFYNGANQALVYKDIEKLDQALLLEKGTRLRGAKHIRIKHLNDETKKGYVTKEEVLEIGKNIRKFLQSNEPFIDSNGARLYEWGNTTGDKFRLVVNDANRTDAPPASVSEEIITFYSNRNLKEGETFEFKNPALRERDNLNKIYGDTLGELENHNAIPFTDSKDKEQILSKETQEQWLKTFNLKNIDEAYIPHLPQEAKEALGGKEIRLQKGSLLKLVSQGREDFIPQIKQVLDEPEAILKDSDNDFLFAKHLKDEDYFVNVSVDKGEYLVSISNGIKEANNIQNKLSNGAEVIYQSPNANSNLQTLLQASRYSTNKIDNAIIPQSKPFVSTKANFTKEQWQNLTTQEKIQAFREQRARGLERLEKESLQEPLSTEEIKAIVSKWDLENPKAEDRLLIAKVEGAELEQLQKEFNFKGNYPLAREIDAQHIKHALNRHTNEKNPANIPTNLNEILENYPNIAQNYDKRVITNHNTIIYTKQVNEHFIAIEEALTGQDKLRFVTAWKTKGNLNEEVLFKNAKVFPNELAHKVASDKHNPTQPQGGTSHNQNLSNAIIPQNKALQKKKAKLQEKQLESSALQKSATKEVESQTKARGLEELESQQALQAPKQKTINAVDNYAQSEEFKALSPDKQQAILRLKEIEPSPMPKEIKQADLENLNIHFSSKQDQTQREYYLKLFNDTKENPHITLETLGKNGEERKEYIKAYQHKKDKDLYYIAITQEKDTINITGYPTTQINKIIGDIKKSKKVAEAFEGIQQTATPLQNNLSPQGANAIIPQNKALQKDSKLTQEIAQLNKQARGLYKQYHRAKDIVERHQIEREYTKTLDKIYNLKAQDPDEIIDVDFIAKEPDITKRIEWKRHNQRAKQIQEINAKLAQIDKEATSNLVNGDALQSLINQTKLLEKKKAKLQEKQLESSALQKSATKEVESQTKARGLEELESQQALQAPKQKTINAVDNYAQSEEFKALSPDKQQAILRLKEIEPSPMPENISLKDFENLRTHFESKADQAQREAYLKLFELTKNEPDIVLNVLKNGELREEYIKAFQHKESKDLYYLAITKDEREITGIPTTKIKKVINEIRDCERIESAGALERITYPAAPIENNLNSQRSSNIIPQNKALQKDSKLTQEIAQLNKQARGLYKQYHRAKDIVERHQIEREYTKTLDKIYNLKAQDPDEIIDVDFIAKEPDITKRIEWKRHNQRAKRIQELSARESTTTNPQVKTGLQSQIQELEAKQSKAITKDSTQEDLQPQITQTKARGLEEYRNKPRG